jgi:hypothetical protein
MFSGAQVALYPMTTDFVGVITTGLRALDPHRDRLRIDTDDISTQLAGPPEVLFPALRDLYVAAAATRVHCVLHATLSRGCPDEPDEPMFRTDAFVRPDESLAERQSAAHAAVRQARPTGEAAAAQFSYHSMHGFHRAEVHGCVDFLRMSGVFDHTRNRCSRLRGDAGPVFTTLAQAFCRFGPPQGHVAVDVTVSANSPYLGWPMPPRPDQPPFGPGLIAIGGRAA